MVVLGSDGDDGSPTRDLPGDPPRGAEPPPGAEGVGADCERFGGLTDPSILQRDANVEVGPLTFVSLHEYTRQPAGAFEPVRPVEEARLHATSLKR